MRVTKEKLIKLSETFIRQRALKDRTILCAYLTGSILKEYPFINGTTDVDMIIIHTDLQQAYREPVSISEEATFDIYHYPKEYFQNPRNLRTDPWIGSSLCFDPLAIFKKGHWYEFILSSVESSFFVPENVMSRALVFNKEAHKYFSALSRFANTTYDVTYVFNYLLCLENALNSLACLTRNPLTMRNMLRSFTEVCAELEGADELPKQAAALITKQPDVAKFMPYYVQHWSYYFDYFAAYTNPGFYPEYAKFRLPYYIKAAQGYVEADLPSAVWIMLTTWTHINAAMRIEQNEAFHSFLMLNGLHPQLAFERMKELDAFLERVDDTIDAWGRSKGISDGTAIYMS